MKKLYTIPLLSCLIGSTEQLFTMYSSTTRRMTPAATALGTIGLTTFGIGRGEDDRVIPGVVHKGPDMRVTLPQLTTAYQKLPQLTTAYQKLPQLTTAYQKLPQSKPYITTKKYVQSGMSKLEQDIDKILYPQDNVSLDGRTFSDLTSNKERLAYLKNALKDIPGIDDVDLGMFLFLLKFPENNVIFEKFIQHIKNIGQINQNMINQFYAQIFIKLTPEDAIYDQAIEKEIQDFGYTRNVALETSIHETAHTLMNSLLAENQISFFTTRTVILSKKIGGYFQALKKHNHQFQDLVLIEFDQLKQDTLAEIMTNLSGGIGSMIFDIGFFKDKKLSFQEWKNRENYGMGTKDIPGADLYTAYKLAEEYVKWSALNNRVSKHQELPELDPAQVQADVEALLEELYEKSYDILWENRSKLEDMGIAVFEEKTIFNDKIEQIVGKPRPKLDFELTLKEKLQQDIVNWLGALCKKIQFYDEQHPTA